MRRSRVLTGGAVRAVGVIFDQFSDGIEGFATAYKVRLASRRQALPTILQDAADLGLAASYFRGLGRTFEAGVDYVARDAPNLASDISEARLIAAWDGCVVPFCPARPSKSLTARVEARVLQSSGRRAP